jgi:hypothetical protein
VISFKHCDVVASGITADEHVACGASLYLLLNKTRCLYSSICMCFFHAGVQACSQKQWFDCRDASDDGIMTRQVISRMLVLTSAV